MRKLKLQVQISIDGFIGGPNGESDWITWNMDKKLIDHVTDITNSVDTILMGRKMVNDFIPYWIDYVKNKPDSEEYPFAKQMVDYPKIVFTKTLKESNWKNTTLATGDIVEEVNKLKKLKGRDMIVYGGADFVSSLIKNNLIDEYHLFVNPTAIGKGLPIFSKAENYVKLRFVNSTAYDCGIIENVYAALL
jgi:dihydrofolate reductase